MKIAFQSNWHQPHGCGVAEFGRNFAQALEVAGHRVQRVLLREPYEAEKVLVNWDSGTMPQEGSNYPTDAIYFVHHVYRGRPEVIDEPGVLTLCPIKGFRTYFPYPVPTARFSPPVTPRTLGVTTLRREGLDYLGAACARSGWTLCPPDRWRSTEEEIERLAGCEAVGAWYTDSPGRSLALATMLAAQRPTLLNLDSQMFEYAAGSEEIYWEPYSNQDVGVICSGLERIAADLASGTEIRPEKLASAWSWPTAIAALEALW